MRLQPGMRLHDVSIMFHIFISGGITAAVVTLFGLPSLRIKGFYLAVATLAAQFFLVWLFNRVAWFYNYSASGQINAPDRAVFGHLVTGPKYRRVGQIYDLPCVSHLCGHCRTQFDTRILRSKMVRHS